MRGRSVALIRTVAVDAGALRLASELRPYFGDDVAFLVDRYHDTEAPALEMDGHVISVGGRFLESHGLPAFQRVGWQCGDFMYYAGAEALPDRDFYWLVEDDVSLRLDVRRFFGRYEERADDLLITRLAAAPATWRWTPTMERAAQQVYKAFFPLSRLSRRAAVHALGERQAYTATARLAGPGLRPRLYANDEAFLATTLVRDGFVCTAMDEESPELFAATYTHRLPVHPDELGFISERVVHPVSDGARARRRFAQLLERPGVDRTRVDRRLTEFAARLGTDRLADFAGVGPDLQLLASTRDRETDAPRHVQALLDELRPALVGATPGARFVRAWVYGDATVVCEFGIRGERIAFDITNVSGGASWQLDVLVRRSPGLGPIGVLSGERVAANRLRLAHIDAGSGTAREIARLVVAAVQQVVAGGAGPADTANH